MALWCSGKHARLSICASVGSNPTRVTILQREVAQPVSAPDFESGGCGCESHLPRQGE